MSKKGSKNIKSNILALFFGILFSIIILEIFLQIYNPFPFRIQGDEIQLQANHKTVFANENDTVIVSRNSLGFRGKELPVNTEGLQKIITIGGSTTECIALTDGESWPELIHTAFEDTDKKIWVNNAGFAGHSSFGHAFLLRDYVLKLKPDYVLFLVGINEIGRADIHDFDKYFLENEKSYKNILAKSELYNTALNISRALRAKQFKLNDTSYDLSTMESAENTEEMTEQLIQHHQDKYIPGFKDRLTTLVDMCLENKVKPILVTQPMLYGDLMDPTTGIDLSNRKIFEAGKDNERLSTFFKDHGEVNISSLSYWKLLDRYNDVSRELSVTKSIPMIDLAKRMPKDSKYYLDAIHFTTEGSQQVADILEADLNKILN